MCPPPETPDELGEAIKRLVDQGYSDELIRSWVELKLSQLRRAAEKAHAKAEHKEALASISDRQWRAIRDEAASREGAS